MSTDEPADLDLGAWRITILRVATVETRLQRLVPDADPDEDVAFPSNVVLCRRGDDTVLLDAGEASPGIPPGLNSTSRDLVPLDEALASAGCAPEDVDAVVITHLDFDHLDGVVLGTLPDGLRPAFPDARIVLPAGARAHAGSDRIAPAEANAAPILAALAAAGARLEEVAPGVPIVDGMTFVDTPGHRAVHAAVEIRDAGRRFLFVADAFHIPEEFAHPEWSHAFDFDPAQAVATRERVLADVGPDDVVAVSHTAGFARLERRGRGAAWISVP